MSVRRHGVFGLTRKPQNYQADFDDFVEKHSRDACVGHILRTTDHSVDRYLVLARDTLFFIQFPTLISPSLSCAGKPTFSG